MVNVGLSTSPVLTVIGNTTPIVVEMLQQANREMRQLSRTGRDLPVFQREYTFVTVAAENQGDLETLAPGLMFITEDTMWDRDLVFPIAGPLSPQQWQLQQARQFTGPYYQYRIWLDTSDGQRKLSFNPAPEAGKNIWFEGGSQYGVVAADNTLKRTFTLDTDSAMMDELLVEMAVSYRWKKSKGYADWVDYKAEYDQQLDLMKGQDGGRRSFMMLSDRRVPWGIGLGNVQDGNFPPPQS